MAVLLYTASLSYFYGHLAQLAERTAVNREVIGSFPIMSVTLPFSEEIYIERSENL